MATVIESNIGALLEFTHPSGWESATDNDLVTADQVRIGLCEPETFDFTANFNIAGATTDATRYRELKNVDDAAYNFQTSTGTKFTFTAAGTAGIRQQEAFLRTGQIWAFQNSPGHSTFARFCQCTRADQIFYQMAFEVTTKANHINQEGVTVWALALRHLIVNCIVIGNNGINGVGRPFQYGGTPSAGNRRLRNSLAWKCRGTANGLADVIAENTACLRPEAVTGWAGTWNAASTNNAGTSTAAPGSNPQDNVLPGNEFVDQANQDFHLVEGGQLADNGADLTGTLDEDYEGTTRTTPYDIGPYDFVLSGGMVLNTSLWGEAASVVANSYYRNSHQYYKEIR